LQAIDHNSPVFQGILHRVVFRANLAQIFCKFSQTSQTHARIARQIGLEQNKPMRHIMKRNRRWMKSAIEASKKDVRLPWDRKVRRKPATLKGAA